MLSVPASSTPSERLFSQSGLLSGHQFSRTTPKNLELRVLAKLNMKKDWDSFIFYLVLMKISRACHTIVIFLILGVSAVLGVGTEEVNCFSCSGLNLSIKVK
jgi:hypothetical protein